MRFERPYFGWAIQAKLDDDLFSLLGVYLWPEANTRDFQPPAVRTKIFATRKQAREQNALISFPYPTKVVKVKITVEVVEKTPAATLMGCRQNISESLVLCIDN